MKRKLTIIAAALVGTSLIFGSGFYLGVKSWDLIFHDLTTSTVELMPLQMHIEQLDRGDNKALRESLNLELDVQIIKTYQLLKESTNQDQNDKASKFLRKIAMHRALHPATYPASASDPERDQAVNYVNSILAEFIEYKGESNQKMSLDK